MEASNGYCWSGILPNPLVLYSSPDGSHRMRLRNQPRGCNLISLNMEREHINQLAIFGATGSIGQSTLEVVRRNPHAFAVRYMSGNSNADLLCAMVREFRPAAVAVSDPAAAAVVRAAVGDITEVLDGELALVELAGREDYGTMVSSLVGFAGLLPTIAAIRAGHHIALANKETLVVAGELISTLLSEHSVQLLPVDSEHSAVYQCLVGEPRERIARIILTASGGPFRGWTVEQLLHVTPQQALKHPNWSMGSKITIDSATLMNKGLEVIEARWLFDVPAERIDVLVHPQSIVHSLVEFTDGSVKAQLGMPDMKLPIQYALTWPDRGSERFTRMDLATIGSLTFEAPDRTAFPCLGLAYDALEARGNATTILNAANEIAVAAFLRGELPFSGIPALIDHCLQHVAHRAVRNIEDIVESDRETRAHATAHISSLSFYQSAM